jgi:hypothetical protein
MVHKISIAEDFSPYPAGRYPEDGEYNGAKFRDNKLLPLLRGSHKVSIDIDGVALLPSSFWEEIWGGLIRDRGFTTSALRGLVEITTTDPELSSYPEIAWEMAEDAERIKGNQFSRSDL